MFTMRATVNWFIGQDPYLLETVSGRRGEYYNKNEGKLWASKNTFLF